MQDILLTIKDLLASTIWAVIESLGHNWLTLTLAILMAVALKTYVNTDKLNKALLRRTKISILASVLLGAFTPLCACGTTAVILGMLSTTLPWGPIMAFLTSSPLMSPDGFIMIWGTIGPQFAVALTIASLVIGLSSGYLTHLIERKTTFLNNQTRYQEKNAPSSCSCAPAPAACTCTPAPITACTCGAPALAVPAQGPCCESDHAIVSKIIEDVGREPEQTDLDRNAGKSLGTAIRDLIRKLKLRELFGTFVSLGLRQILLNFAIFVAIGYLINYFIPSSIVSVLLGNNSLAAVPLAAVVGLPLYVTTESGIPIITSLLQSGASEGAMLAFIITGSATSAWVIAGISTFMKRRAVGLYLAFVLLGGILSGYIYEGIKLLTF